MTPTKNLIGDQEPPTKRAKPRKEYVLMSKVKEYFPIVAVWFLVCGLTAFLFVKSTEGLNNCYEEAFIDCSTGQLSIAECKVIAEDTCSPF
jgi:hypothetical protein